MNAQTIDPTPAEIADMAAAIRSAWSADERLRRARVVPARIDADFHEVKTQAKIASAESLARKRSA